MSMRDGGRAPAKSTSHNGDIRASLSAKVISFRIIAIEEIFHGATQCGPLGKMATEVLLSISSGLIFLMI